MRRRRLCLVWCPVVTSCHSAAAGRLQHAQKTPTCTETEHRNTGTQICWRWTMRPFSIHTHTEGHLIMSASVPAPMLTHSRAKECPRTATSAPAPAHSSPLLTHIHAVLIEKTEIFFFFPSLITCSVQCLSVQLPGLSDTQVLQPTITVMAGLSHAAASGSGCGVALRPFSFEIFATDVFILLE